MSHVDSLLTSYEEVVTRAIAAGADEADVAELYNHRENVRLGRFIIEQGRYDGTPIADHQREAEQMAAAVVAKWLGPE